MRYTFLLLIIGLSHFCYAHHYDDIEVGSFDRFEEIVNGPTDHILDIVFSGINIEAKNWESARSFLPVEGAKFRQLNAYFEAPKPFAYYFNTGKKESP